MNEAQKQLIDLAVEMDGICREHGISFAVGFGAGIGVERNGGFLPWDDDIDLIITRDQMRKLEQVLDEHMPPRRALVTDKRYPNYHHSVYRYVNEDSTRLARFRIMDGSPLGQLLEFFVFDPMPNGEAARREFEKWTWLYTELQSSAAVVARDFSPPHAIDAGLYREYLARMDAEGRQAVLDEIEREHLTFDADECDMYACRWGSRLMTLRSEWLDDIVYRDFDGYELPFLRNNIEHLQQRYGYSWNLVPASDEQLTHGVIVSSTVPYDRHIDQLRDLGRKVGLERAIQKNTADRLEARFARLGLQRCAAHGKKAFLQVLVDRMRADGATFDAATPDALTHAYPDFFDVMFQRNYCKWGIVPDLDADLAQSVFMAVLYAQRMGDAQVMRELYGADAIGACAQAPELFMRLQAAKYRGECDEVRALEAELAQLGLANHIEVERARAWLAVRDAAGGRDADEGRVDALFAQFAHADDPEIVKYQGDLLMRAGCADRARACYARARNTRDGMLLRALDAIRGDGAGAGIASDSGSVAPGEPDTSADGTAGAQGEE